MGLQGGQARACERGRNERRQQREISCGYRRVRSGEETGRKEGGRAGQQGGGGGRVGREKNRDGTTNSKIGARLAPGVSVEGAKRAWAQR